MRKIRLYIMFLFAITIFISCTNEENIEGLKAHEILVVTLELDDNINIKEVTLKSTGGTDKILGDKIENKRKLKLKAPQKGEGTFSICVYTDTDTLCSAEDYIEGGYRPKLRFKNNKFETIERF